MKIEEDLTEIVLMKTPYSFNHSISGIYKKRVLIYIFFKYPLLEKT
jgi:hypothetical protein